MISSTKDCSVGMLLVQSENLPEAGFVWHLRLWSPTLLPSLFKSCWLAKKDLICAKVPGLHQRSPCLTYFAFYTNITSSSSSNYIWCRVHKFLFPSPKMASAATSIPLKDRYLSYLTCLNFWPKEIRPLHIYASPYILEVRNWRHVFGKELAGPNFSRLRF